MYYALQTYTGAEIEAFRQSLIDAKGQGDTIRSDVSDMRRRLAEAKPTIGAFDAKDGPGRMQDVQLAAQTLALCAGSEARATTDQIAAGVAKGLITAADGADLNATAGLLWRVQAGARLLAGGVLDPEAAGEGGRQFILSQTDMTDMDQLADAMADHADKARTIFDRLLKERT